ncbi:MAG: DUF5979 domain-containing protein [Clostridiales Family XIII bacterium]|nr:DUF5979 domain-containing protein [Clostridiales Family XIII bacterium]
MPQIGSVRDGSTLNVKLQTASLTIANTVAGDYADKTKDFTFTVKLMYADGTLITTRDLTLKHGQSITISDILVGGMVSVTETNYDGYTVTFRDSETPDMEYAGDTLTRSMTGNLGTFTFTNTRETINPTGVGGQDADAALPVILSALLLSAASYLGVIIRRAKRMVETEK